METKQKQEICPKCKKFTAREWEDDTGQGLVICDDCHTLAKRK